MHVYRSRLLWAAIVAVGLTASAAWAGGRGCDGKGSPCGAATADCKGKCSECGKPCQAGSNRSAKACNTKACTTKACDANGCPEFCCEEDCCGDDCSCDAECRERCGKACGEGACCDEECSEECCDGECCDPSADCSEGDGCCCDGWFFSNWFKGWNTRSKKFSVTNKNFCPGMKCEKFQDSAKFRCPLGFIYGGAMGCKPTCQNPAHFVPGHCHPGEYCAPPCGVLQAAAAGCNCKCDCGKCQCSKANQAACGFGLKITCPAQPGCCAGPGCATPPVCTGKACAIPCPPTGCGPMARWNSPLPPPPMPPMPVCPAIGPHPEMFHKLAGVMAENAALHARLEAKEHWADEQEGLRAALGEARHEIARLTAAQTGGNRDQVLVEWIKSQAEASARKDEMLVEVVAAVVELHAAKAETSTNEKLEAKIEKLEAALKQVKEENVRLRTQVTQQRRAGKRVSVSTDSGSCPEGGAYREWPVYKLQGEPVECPK